MGVSPRALACRLTPSEGVTRGRPPWLAAPSPHGPSRRSPLALARRSADAVGSPHPSTLLAWPAIRSPSVRTKLVGLATVVARPVDVGPHFGSPHIVTSILPSWLECGRVGWGVQGTVPGAAVTHRACTLYQRLRTPETVRPGRRVAIVDHSGKDAICTCARAGGPPRASTAAAVTIILAMVSLRQSDDRTTAAMRPASGLAHSSDHT